MNEENTETVPAPEFHSDGRPAERHEGSLKASSLTVSILLHAALLVVLAFVTMVGVKEEPPELTVLSAGLTNPAPKIDKKIFDKTQRTKPSSSSKAARLIVATDVSPVAIPMIETDNLTPTIGSGVEFGTGLGIGGGGDGIGANFFGSTSKGRRFAFIIDVSLSLSDVQFKMIKDELTKSLKRLPSSVQYQVIFFSGPAWFAEADYDEGRKQVTHGGKRYQWIKGVDNYNFEPEDVSRLYAGKWIPATKTNLTRTMSRIEKVKRSLGTDWKWPLDLALRMTPKPDIVYFLTDGSMQGGDQKVDEAVRLNQRIPGPKAKINSISMMEPRAIEDLAEMAERTGGEFTIVEQDGTTRRPKNKK